MKVKTNVKAGQTLTISATSFTAGYQAQYQEQVAAASASIVLEA